MLQCLNFQEPYLYFFTSEVPKLMYYSHFTSMVASVIIAVLLYVKSKTLSSRILVVAMTLFFLWTFLSLVVWTNVSSQVILFSWSLFGLLYALVCVLLLYFVYVFVEKKDISLKVKWLFGAILMPLAVLAPTTHNVVAMDLYYCEAIDSLMYDSYSYGIGLLTTILTAVYLKKKYNSVNAQEKSQILLLAVGVELFLISFFVTGSVGILSVDSYSIEFYGLFGMTFFTVIIGYLIVKYKIFNIKILETQALVVATLVSIGSMFTFVDSTAQRVLAVITLGFTSISGWFLVHAIKREIKQKEELKTLSEALKKSNQKLHEADLAKTEFMSIASHQLRTPLTAIKGYCVLMEDGSYGPVTEKMVMILKKIMYSSDRLTNLVENLLSVTRLEAGRMTYTFAPEQMETLLSELFDTFHFAALNKKISISLKLPEKPLPPITMDKQKIQEVISNLIDNAIKYTPSGGVEVTLDQNPVTQKSRLTVKDSGIGIPASEIPFLFAKFSRGNDTGRLHVSGTGLGLYVAKNIVEAHHGTIRIESEGEGKGTSFIVEI